MKKLLSITTMIALAFAIPMSSCNKRSELTDSNLNDGRASIWNQGIEINKKYRLAKSTNQPLTNAATPGAVAVAVVGADLIATAGTICSTTSWWAIGPIGMVGSAVVGAVAGAVGSALAYHGTHRISNSPTDWSAQMASMNTLMSAYVITPDDNPFGNPCDSAGYKHNEFLKRFYTTSNRSDVDAKTFMFNSNNLTSNEDDALQANPTDGAHQLVQYIYDHPITDVASARSLAAASYTITGTSPFLQGFTNTLLDGVLGCQNLSDVVSLVHDYEQVYVPQGQLTQFEHEYVLKTLATAKYSAVLWQYVYSNY